MSENKSSLHSSNHHNNKLIGSGQTTKHQKGVKSRGSFAKHDDNTQSARNSDLPINLNSHDCAGLLVERCLNVPEHTSGYSSYRNSLQQSLLSKLRKQNKYKCRLGYVSNQNSKHNSPSKKRKSNNVNNAHKRNFSGANIQVPKSQFKRALFDYHNVIGKGGFGKVWKVELKRNKKVFAMKQMSKALIIAKKSVPSVMNEKKLLASLKNNFLVNMIQSFQDRETLYLVMDYLPGGDLRHHIARRKRFSEQEARFLIACILLGLEYLHEKNIIHRDIKPENIVLDDRGYARITDLGVARFYRPNNSSDTSGTPGYMSPEVLCRQNHTFSVDHFALGIIAYELMLRKRPYYGRNRKQIRDQILAKQVQIKKSQIPDDWSLQSADFINRLIQRKPNSRLGFNGSHQIKNHPWMRQFPFHKLMKQQYQSPYIPNLETIRGWTQNRISSQNSETKELIMQNEMLLRDKQVQQLFNGYESQI